MRKSGTLRILYLVCAICIVNAILSPAVRSGFSSQTEIKTQSSGDNNFLLGLLSMSGEFPDDERDYGSDDDDYVKFDLSLPGNFKFVGLSFNKIPSQESLLEYPSFSKFKPPPQA